MRRFSTTLLIALFITPVLSGCDALSQGVRSNTDVVARAAGHQLEVDEVAGLLSNQSQLPNRPEVVEAIANLWIDYTLLSVAMHRDSTMESFDLTPVVQREIEQLKVFKLRDSVIQPDTALTEEELRRLFQEELPGARVKARHILLNYPDQPTDEERDSVMALARSLKSRAESGEDFAALAREYSDDQATVREGGDLGWFERGEMVRPFEEAALAADPGEIVGPVQSPYGLHVIKVEDQDLPRFEESRRSFRSELVSRRTFAAESAYVDQVETPANVTIPDEAYEIVRELARRPQMSLSRRAGDRAVTRYEDGKLTAAEFREYIQARPPGFRNQVAQGEEQQLDIILRGLTRAELLVRAAEREGVEVTEVERDSLLNQARNQVVHAARSLDLWPLEPEAGTSLDDAIHRAVTSTLGETLAGRKDVLRLGTIAYALRQNLRAEVFEHTFGRVVAQIQQTSPGGAARPRAQPQTGRPQPQAPVRAPNAPPDTTGG